MPLPVPESEPNQRVHACGSADTAYHRVMLIRPETAADHAAIRAVVSAAFARPDEADLVEQLRRNGDAAISLVAEAEGAVIGHVLLSPMAAPFAALGLAPLSVLPAHQRSGVGSALMHAAIDTARASGAAAIFLLGNPGYYQRFGFSAAAAKPFASPYAGPHFMALPLVAPLPATQGAVAYAAAFGGLG